MLFQVLSTKLTGEIEMLRNANTFFSSIIAGVTILAVFFFIMPWLLLVLAVAGIAVFASMFLGRGSINITTIRITNTPHGNLIQTVKTVSSTVEHRTREDRELQERNPDSDITIYPDGSISEVVVTEEDSL